MDLKDRLGCQAGTAIEVSLGSLDPILGVMKNHQGLFKKRDVLCKGAGDTFTAGKVQNGRGKGGWIDAGARGTLLAARWKAL